VNGALDAQATSPFAAPTASTMNFTLGNYYNSGWGTWWLNGELGEPRVYGRQLSAAEITALYQSGVAPAGPLAEWLFAEGGGAQVADTSANGTPGTLVGGAAARFVSDVHP
jgi:hypothetical protein